MLLVFVPDTTTKYINGAVFERKTISPADLNRPDLIAKGVAVTNYEAKVFEQINNLVDNDQTKEYLLELSKVLS